MGHRHMSAEGCLADLLRDAQQVKEGDGKRGEGKERGEKAGGLAYDDIHLPNV